MYVCACVCACVCVCMYVRAYACASIMVMLSFVNAIRKHDNSDKLCHKIISAVNVIRFHRMTSYLQMLRHRTH